MTRKDFEIVAEMLGVLDAEEVDKHRADIERTLRQSNANFDGKKFWQAVEGWR